MRIDVGDLVMLRKVARDALLEQGVDVGGNFAEVVDCQQVSDGVDLTLKFEGLKTFVTDIPLEFVQHVGIS
jgi:hypothetical protein